MTANSSGVLTIGNGKCTPVKVASQTTINNAAEEQNLPTTPLVYLDIATSPTITAIKNGTAGQVVTYVGGGITITFKDTGGGITLGNLRMAGDFTMHEGDTITFVFDNVAKKWTEICRSSN